MLEHRLREDQVDGTGGNAGRIIPGRLVTDHRIRVAGAIDCRPDRGDAFNAQCGPHRFLVEQLVRECVAVEPRIERREFPFARNRLAIDEHPHELVEDPADTGEVRIVHDVEGVVLLRSGQERRDADADRVARAELGHDSRHAVPHPAARVQEDQVTQPNRIAVARGIGTAGPAHDRVARQPGREAGQERFRRQQHFFRSPARGIGPRCHSRPFRPRAPVHPATAVCGGWIRAIASA